MPFGSSARRVVRSLLQSTNSEDGLGVTLGGRGEQGWKRGQSLPQCRDRCPAGAVRTTEQGLALPGE